MTQKKQNSPAPPAEEYKLLETSEITVSEDLNSRFGFTSTDDLEADILKRTQLHPIICRRFGSEIILVAGGRRLRAITKINEVPGLLDEAMKVKSLIHGDMSEKDAFLASISENRNRDDASILDTAWQVSELIKKHGMTQKEVAEHYGKDQSWVSRIRKVLTLGPEIKEKIASGELGYTDALELLSIEDEGERADTAKKLTSNDANVTVSRQEVRSKTRSGKNKAEREVEYTRTRSEEAALGRITLKQGRELFERWGTPNVEKGEERKPIHSVCSAIASFLDGKIQDRTLRKVLTGYLK